MKQHTPVIHILFSKPWIQGLLPKVNLVVSSTSWNYLYWLYQDLAQKAARLNYIKPDFKNMDAVVAILQHLQSKSLRADFINPIDDGGVMIEFRIGETYFCFDVYNDGEASLLRKVGSSPSKVFTTDTDPTILLEHID